MADGIVQAHIIFSGRVQGVGFRFTVQRYASQINLKGWVRNLPNGSVELLVEGPKEKIEELCQEIASEFEGYIKDRTVQFAPAEAKFKCFQIAY